jgi:hypothetical protein
MPSRCWDQVCPATTRCLPRRRNALYAVRRPTARLRSALSINTQHRSDVDVAKTAPRLLVLLSRSPQLCAGPTSSRSARASDEDLEREIYGCHESTVTAAGLVSAAAIYGRSFVLFRFTYSLATENFRTVELRAIRSTTLVQASALESAAVSTACVNKTRITQRCDSCVRYDT